MPANRTYRAVDHFLCYTIRHLPEYRRETAKQIADITQRMQQIEADGTPSVGVIAYDSNVTYIPYQHSDPTGRAAERPIRKEWYEEYAGLHRSLLAFQREQAEYALLDTMTRRIMASVKKHRPSLVNLIVVHYRDKQAYKDMPYAYSNVALYTHVGEVLGQWEDVVQRNVNQDTIPLLWMNYSRFCR
jgi:hypothetical protein